MEIEVQGLKVNYLDSGNTDRPVVLFLHGWGAPVSTYALLTEYLSQSFRVIAPNLPGFGGSDEPKTDWTVDDYTDFVLEFLKSLGLSEVILMCHSFGGRISIKLLSRPEQPLTVKKAVFLDAAGIRPRRGMKYYFRVYTYKLGKKLISVPMIARLWPDLVEKVKKRSGSADYRNASPRMRAVMVRCIEEDLTAHLSKINASTLLIWGENDTATPLSDGQKMEALIPDAGLVTLHGAGHFGFLERWPQCQRVLDSFLS